MVGIVMVVAVSAGLVFVQSTPFGASPSGDRQLTIEQSPQWNDGRFASPQPLMRNYLAAIRASAFGSSDTNSPSSPPAIEATDTRLLTTPPDSGLRITWFGHSSMLWEIDGARILVDPFWGDQAGPTGLWGTKPFFSPRAALTDLGPIDAVVISHDHWDHLDYATIHAMKDWSTTRFVVPLGIGADLERWGSASNRIQELDWWQTAQVGPVQLAATPARHVSGRDPLRTDETLWSGWAVIGPEHRAWYSGDSGYFDDVAQIGQRLGPFDVTLIDSGEYDPAWPDNHFGPELAVEANEQVGGELMIPIHWGLFNLSPHSWTEPVERVRAEAECRNQDLLVLTPGMPTEPDANAVRKQRQWWPALPWRTAAEAPLNPTVSGDPAHRLDIVPCVLGGG